MKKRVVIVSDLHLGWQPELEDFDNDGDFCRFLSSKWFTGDDFETRLVFNGDVFDIWQVARDWTDYKVEYPVSAIELKYDSQSERSLLARILDRHNSFASALAEFSKYHGVSIIAGNHDHSLVNSEVRSLLATHQIHYDFKANHCFGDSDLKLHVAHGHQRDKYNFYKDLDNFDWKEEPAGYYFVKDFFNRVEYLYPDIENSPLSWGKILRILTDAKRDELLKKTIRFFLQYLKDERVPRHLNIFATPPKTIYSSHGPLGVKSTTVPVFSYDRMVDAHLRDMYFSDDEARSLLDEVLVELNSSKLKSEPVLEASTMAVTVLGVDTGVDGADELGLDPQDYKFVSFGHTHEDCIRPFGQGMVYINSGSWVKGSGQNFVVVEQTDGATPRAGLGSFRRGANAVRWA